MDKIKLWLDISQDGQIRARTEDDQIVVHGRDVNALRVNVAAAVRRAFGETRPVALLVGRPRPAALERASLPPT